ncbi:MAG: hypothetical protein R2874_03550 [Desulfobacterales bacterium]
MDACALSAAAVQAAGLNEIADLNGEMAYESAKAQWFLSSGTWHNFSFAVSARNFFYNSKSGVLDHIRRYQKEANAYFGTEAEAIAEDVRRRNFPESFLTARHDNLRIDGLKREIHKSVYILILLIQKAVQKSQNAGPIRIIPDMRTIMTAGAGKMQNGRFRSPVNSLCLKKYEKIHLLMWITN